MRYTLRITTKTEEFTILPDFDTLEDARVACDRYARRATEPLLVAVCDFDKGGAPASVWYSAFGGV